jgi:hypothetical protein
MADSVVAQGGAVTTDDDITTLVRDLVARDAITRVLMRYAAALDSREWRLLDECFTPDAVADYGGIAGVNRGLEAIKAVVGALERFDATQHLIGNVTIELAGDRARTSCYLQAQHILRGTEGGESFMLGGTYRDEFVYTQSGWRICNRQLEPSWQIGNPRVLKPAAERDPGHAQ